MGFAGDEYLRSMSFSRRRFIAGGLTAAGVLAASGLVYEFTLDEDNAAIVAAIAPVMLGTAAPVAQVVRGVDIAVAGLPPAVQSQISQLFGILRFAPSRMFVAGIWNGWQHANDDEIAAFLNRWRYSPVAKLRGAYDALHQLIMAAWYGNEQSWTAIGYPGPPAVR
jgi:hypothetical protein